MLALSSVMGKERLMSNWQVLALTGISFALILSCMLLSRVVVRLLHAEDADRGLLRFLFSFCNISYIGYPVVQSLFGAWKIPLAVEHSQKSLSDCLVNRVHHLSDRA